MGEVTYLEFGQSETTSGTNFCVVPLRLAMHNRTKWASGGSGKQSLRLLDTIRTSTELAGRLIEPGANMTLPPLVEVGIGYHMISLHHFSRCSNL